MKIFTNSISPGTEFDILCFSGKFHDQEYFELQGSTRFSDLLARIPAGWEPDVVIFRSPFYRPIPEGIEESPFPTVAIFDDWFGGIDYLPDNLRRFDYIVTDKYSVEVLNKLGFDNVDYWPVFGFSPQKFYRIPDLQRTIDVFFAGNHNINIQYERLAWLRRLCKLDPAYTVKVHHNLFNEAYVQSLNQARIVFNRSIKSEMNMRAYEACACGALLFMEQENREIRDFLIPDKECVLYSDDTLEEQLVYYLKHEKQREEIAEKGYRKIQQFSEGALFKQLIGLIESKKLTPGCGRKKGVTYTVDVEHRNLVQEALSIHGINGGLIQKIMSLIKKHPLQTRLFNDSAVFLMTFAEGYPGSDEAATSLRSELVVAAFELIAAVVAQEPENIVALFNLAQFYSAINQTGKAEETYRKILDFNLPIQFSSVKGVVFPVHYFFPLRYLWSHAIEQHAGNESKWTNARINVLKCIAASKLGIIAQEKKNYDEAFSLFSLADAFLPGQPLVHNYLPFVLKQLNEPALARKASEKALYINPFNTTLWKHYIQILIELGECTLAQQVIDGCMLCLKRVQFSTDETTREIEALRDTLAAAEGALQKIH